MELDLLIKDGLVVDGSGAPGFRADIGVANGRIVSVGAMQHAARHVVDAEGLVVTPGFIDVHTHLDAQAFWDPLGTSSCWHGVTTVVTGNCGFSLAPGTAAQREMVLRNLLRTEGLSGAVIDAGVDWTWDSFASYLDVVDGLPKGINLACNIGHSALRVWAMGERAFKESATDDDLARMERELRAALHAGAVGLSTSVSVNHTTPEGGRIASRCAEWSEIARLVRCLASAESALFELAIGDTGEVDKATMLDRLYALAVSTRVPITFGVFAPAAEPDSWRDLLATIARTKADGGTMIGQTHSREISTLYSFRTDLPFDTLPRWADLRKRPLDQQAALLRDADVRSALANEAQGEVQRASSFPLKFFERMRVLQSPTVGNPDLATIAARLGLSPVAALIDIALESNFAAFFQLPASNLDLDDVLTMLLSPDTVMTFSDSGAHVREIMDCSIHTNLLAHWVREREALTLEQAVRMMTAVPAASWGLRGRGGIAQGMAADLNIIDASRVAPLLPEVANDLPTGASRLIQRATGIQTTIVGGQVVLRDGEHTGALPGRLLRRGLDR